MKIDSISLFISDLNIDDFIYNDQNKNLNKFNNNNTMFAKFQTSFTNIENKNKNKNQMHLYNSKNVRETLEEKIEKLKKKLKEEEKKYRYIIKYDELLKNYYLEVVDPKTKKIIKTIPPEFLLKVERHLKKFLKLIENLEHLKKLKQNFHYQEMDKILHEIKIISEDIELPEDDFKNLLYEYTESYFA
ncbi:MAG TPA: hypothetical protein EYH39_03080 [Desulfurobacteriaceae bacterium]|nr:hypothetical protein [Desulfurobacteriaceae bacterium]